MTGDRLVRSHKGKKELFTLGTEHNTTLFTGSIINNALRPIHVTAIKVEVKQNVLNYKTITSHEDIFSFLLFIIGI